MYLYIILPLLVWNIINIFLFVSEFSYTLFIPIFFLLVLLVNYKNVKEYIKVNYIDIILTTLPLYYISCYFSYGGESSICKIIRVIIPCFILLSIFLKTKKFNLSSILKVMSMNISFYFLVPIFIFYTSFSHATASSDLIPARFIPYWIQDSKKISFEKFAYPKIIINENQLDSYKNQIIGLPYKISDGKYRILPYFLIYHDGKLLPTYPLLPGFINYGFYNILRCNNIVLPFPEIVPESPVESKNINYVMSLEKITSSIIAILSIYFFIKLLKMSPISLSNRTSLFMGSIYSLATFHFSTSSQGLWQHGFVEFFLILSLYLLSKTIVLYFNNDTKYFKYSTFALGMVIVSIPFARPSGLLLLFALFLYIPFLSKMDVLKLILRGAIVLFGAIIIFIFLGGINYYLYDNFIGGYKFMKDSKYLLGMTDLWKNSSVNGMINLYFSPGFGLFIFSPFILFFSFSLFRKSKLYYILIILIVIVGYSILYSKYIFWWGGHSYGTRLLTDLSPLYVILISFSYRIIIKYKVIIICFLVSIFFSFFVQLIGSSDKYLFAEWNGCDDRELNEKVWDYQNIAYLYPYQKYRVVVFGEYEMNPSLKCSKFKKVKSTKSYISKLIDQQDKLELLQNWNIYIPKSDLCIMIEVSKSIHSSLNFSLISNKKYIFQNDLMIESTSNQSLQIIKLNIKKDDIIPGNGYFSLIHSGSGEVYFKNIIVRKNKCEIDV